MQPQKVKFKSVQINMKQVSYCCFGCCCFVLFPGGGGGVGGDCFFGLFLVFTVTPGVIYEKKYDRTERHKAITILSNPNKSVN